MRKSNSIGKQPGFSFPADKTLAASGCKANSSPGAGTERPVCLILGLKCSPERKDL